MHFCARNAARESMNAARSERVAIGCGFVKSPPTSFLIKKAAGLRPTGKGGTGSKEPGRAVAGQVTMAQLRDIAKVKMKDMNTDDIDAAARTLAGSARSMGLKVAE